MRKRRLVLFDIDGILVYAGSISFDYWRIVVKKHFGFEISCNDIYLEGKTDKEILKEFLELKGIHDPLSDPRFTPALKDIGPIVRETIRRFNITIKKIPNVERFIQRLVDEGHVIGLLTGNTREKAEIKLRNCGLWKYFTIGAFGDSSDKRSELVSLALHNVQEKIGIKFSQEDVFIIGDTVRDIYCAKEAGVKSLAVATGKESIDLLRGENSDFLFKDFNNIDKILKIFE